MNVFCVKAAALATLQIAFSAANGNQGKARLRAGVSSFVEQHLQITIPRPRDEQKQIIY